LSRLGFRCKILFFLFVAAERYEYERNERFLRTGTRILRENVSWYPTYSIVQLFEETLLRDRLANWLRPLIWPLTPDFKPLANCFISIDRSRDLRLAELYEQLTLGASARNEEADSQTLANSTA
jgi:hypothetical protein